MPHTLTARDLQRLDGAHPDLRKVFIRAAEITDVPFVVLEVLRDAARQRQLVAAGASRTLNSRHLPHPKDGKSRAVDAAPTLDGSPSWDWPLYHKLAPIIKRAAKDVGVAIEWGGDWRRFKDGPHWQLPRSVYP